MKKAILSAILFCSASSAGASELTLNDLPEVLLKLRGCTETRSFLSGPTRVCRVAKEDLWASVGSDGDLTLFKRRSYGDTTYAHGRTVNDLLRDFAAKINSDRDQGKEMLDALGPYLETQ